MAIQNKLYQGTQYNAIAPRRTYQREELLSTEIAEDLNTYKNFGIFHTRADVIVPKTGADGNWIPGEQEGSARAGAIGVRSIFNAYSATLTGNDRSKYNGTITSRSEQQTAWNALVKEMSDFRHSNNAPLLDTPETRRLLRQHNDISVSGLVKASKNGAFSRTPYAYSDFMYCKYLNRVSNNYLITVRRFANPVMDNIKPVGRGRKKADYNRSGIPHPIGTMVTWMGVSGNDMKEILKYSYSMSFEEKKADWQSITKEGGEGLLNSLEAAVNPATRGLWQQGYVHNPLDNFVPDMFGLKDGKGPYSYPPPFSVPGSDSYKVFGPVDRVKTNYMRGSDGLQQEMSFSITFDYELRAYNGINPKQAMLDLLASILSVTYTTGGFWGGGYYGGGMGQASTFRNLNIFKATGGFTNYMDALVHDIATVGAGVQRKINANGGYLETFKTVLNTIGGMLMGSLINMLGRPAKYYAPSLLTEAPCGLWHITIGNPYRPIISMGNMILKKTTITHSGPLGLDDFPTNLTVTCDFDRGKPRDQYGIEAMYMTGNDRIYHGMSTKVFDAYKAAESYKKGTYSTWKISVDNPTVKAVGDNGVGIDVSNSGGVMQPGVERPRSIKAGTRARGSGGQQGSSNSSSTGNTSDTPSKDSSQVSSDPQTSSEAEQAMPDIPGDSLEEIKARRAEYEAEAEEISQMAAGLTEAGSVLSEVFGDPDAVVIYTAAREQQEGSSKKMKQETESTANTGGAQESSGVVNA